MIPVAVPPSAPSVHIADATISSLKVAWAAGDTGGAAVRSWAVWWRAATGGGSWHTRELGRTHTDYVITDLQCGAEYQVSFGVDHRGEDPFQCGSKYLAQVPSR